MIAMLVFAGMTSAVTPPTVNNTVNNTLPTVSLIMPTNSRPEYVRRAVDMIARQDYPRHLIKELIIVDDSPAALQATDVMSLTWPRIVYTNLQERRSVGRMRNIAALRATGDVIAHWDDDDIYGPGRLRAQVAPIARGEADVTLLSHRWTYFVGDQSLYEATSAASWGPHFGTLVYRRKLFARGVRYPDTSEAEDYGWAQHAVEAAGAKLAVVPTVAAADGEPIFVCVRHGSNTWSWSGVKEGALKEGQTGTLVSSSVLSASDRAFAEHVRTSGLLAKLAARRRAAPALNKSPSPDVDVNYFNHLYGVAPVPRPKKADAHAVATAAAAASVSALAPRLDAITYFDWQDTTCALVNGTFQFKYTYNCVNNKTAQALAAKANLSAAVWCITALGCKQTVYDLSSAPITISALPPAPPGAKVGFLGGTQLPSGGYGGKFATSASVTLASSLQLVYYTELFVGGDLDCGGTFDLFLGAWSNLTVAGKLINCGTLTIGSFARLNVGGDVSIGTLNAHAGGVCVDELCDQAFFSSSWHELPDSSCLEFPAIECGCYLKGFQDYGSSHHNCYYSRIFIAGTFSLQSDAELSYYMGWSIGNHALIQGMLLVHKFRPELRIGGNLSVAGGLQVTDFPTTVVVGQHVSVSDGLSLSVAPNGSAWQVLDVGGNLKVDGDVANLYGNVQINGTVESTYTLSIRLPNRLDLIDECLFQSDVKVTKGAVSVSADAEAGTGLNFCGSVSVQGAGQLGGDSAAWHKTVVKGNLSIQDTLTLFDTHMIEVHGALTLGSNLQVEKSASLSAKTLLNVNGDVYAKEGALMTLGGDLAATGVSLDAGAQILTKGISVVAISAGASATRGGRHALCAAAARKRRLTARLSAMSRARQRKMTMPALNCTGMGVGSPGGTAMISAEGNVVVSGPSGILLEDYSRLTVAGNLSTTTATLRAGVVKVRNGSMTVAQGLELLGDDSLDLGTNDLTAASLSANGLSLSAANLVLNGGIGELDIQGYNIDVPGRVAVGTATLQDGLLTAGSFTAAATKASGTLRTTGDFTVASFAPLVAYSPSETGNRSYLDLRTGNMLVRGGFKLLQGMIVHALGTEVNISSLQMDHRSELAAPNAKAITIATNIALAPHVGTQCAGQKGVLFAGNGLGNPKHTIPNGTDPKQVMVCPWTESYDDPDDCTFQHAVSPSGIAPTSNISYNASWLYTYAAINEWCFADAQGSLLFPTTQPCPGGSLTGCYGWCPRSHYSDESNVTCVASCQRLCGATTGRQGAALAAGASSSRSALPVVVEVMGSRRRSA